MDPFVRSHNIFYFNGHSKIWLVKLVGCRGVVQVGGPYPLNKRGGPAEVGACEFC